MGMFVKHKVCNTRYKYAFPNNYGYLDPDLYISYDTVICIFDKLFAQTKFVYYKLDSYP